MLVMWVAVLAVLTSSPSPTNAHFSMARVDEYITFWSRHCAVEFNSTTARHTSDFVPDASSDVLPSLPASCGVPLSLSGAQLLSYLEEVREPKRRGKSAPFKHTKKINATGLVRRGGAPWTIVFAYSPRCPFSAYMLPFLPILAAQFPEIPFFLVDGSMHWKVSTRFMIRGFPSLIVFQRGKYYSTYSGVKRLEHVYAYVEEFYLSLVERRGARRGQEEEYFGQSCPMLADNEGNATLRADQDARGKHRRVLPFAWPLPAMQAVYPVARGSGVPRDDGWLATALRVNGLLWMSVAVSVVTVAHWLAWLVCCCRSAEPQDPHGLIRGRRQL